MNDDGPPGPLKHATVDPASSVFSMMLERISDGVCLQDINGRIEWINPACEKMFGWSLRELLGRHPLEFISPPGCRKLGSEIRDFVYDFSRSIFDQHIIREFQHRNGNRFWVQQSFAFLDLGPAEDQKKVVVTCRDVSGQISIDRKLQQVHANLEHAAYHDDLTGLANRKMLDRFLKSDKVAKAIKDGTLGILQFDIDKFKDINSTLGHAAGDATLRHVSNALRKNSGHNSLACRTGGDEFLFVCLTAESPEALQQRAESLLADISAPLIWKNQRLRIGSSIGASLSTSPDDTGEGLILRADKALYHAKRGGRGQVALYTDAMGQKYRAQMKLVRELNEAIAENQFEVFLQPQLNLRSSTITGCEALIRWNHPERGLLNPGQFLPTAEASGLTSAIDYLSMNMALDALTELRENGFRDLCMSINVSSSILGDVNYPSLLNWALQSRDIEPASVCIEVLETTILEGGELEIAVALERLKSLGVSIALDDFGTGYAGLSHMSTFDVDSIKLDQSMISRLTSDPRNRMIVRSVIRLCMMLGIHVVAEGVETQNQLEILRRARCPVIQGFGLARPMPVADFSVWLKDHIVPPVTLSLESTPRAETVQLIERLR